MACEDEIEAQQHVALPSLERFQARTRRCKERFDAQCVGPGRTTQQGRWVHMVGGWVGGGQVGLWVGGFMGGYVSPLLFPFFSFLSTNNYTYTHTERLAKLWARELEHFQRDYNDKLYNGLVIASLADILLFRFVFKISLLETLGWLLFVFLQVC